MLKLPYVKTIVCASALFTSSVASAAFFDFTTANFGLAGSDTVDFATMSVDGVTVSLSSYTIENDGIGNISSTSLLNSGAGVYVSNSSGNVGVRSNLNGDGTNMDGGSAGDANDLDEGILFTFDQQVTLTFINFDSFSSSDDFNLTVDGIKTLVDHNESDGTVAGIVSNGTQNDYFDFTVTGTEFLVWADGDSDSFRIDSMEVSAVPVPAAVWLFVSGLIGLVGIARRKA